MSHSCAGCQQVIMGPYLNAADQYWHPDHFVCAKCSAPLTQFFQFEGKFYCAADVPSSKRCAKCGLDIKSKVLSAYGKSYHEACFTCGLCDGKLGMEVYVVALTGTLLCERHKDAAYPSPLDEVPRTTSQSAQAPPERKRSGMERSLSSAVQDELETLLRLSLDSPEPTVSHPAVEVVGPPSQVWAGVAPPPQPPIIRETSASNLSGRSFSAPRSQAPVFDSPSVVDNSRFGFGLSSAGSGPASPSHEDSPSVSPVKQHSLSASQRSFKSLLPSSQMRDSGGWLPVDKSSPTLSSDVDRPVSPRPPDDGSTHANTQIHTHAHMHTRANYSSFCVCDLWGLHSGGFCLY
eukprot:TRINITY_DN1723_c0_g1_i6.p1 TRINITY_DN1723_c0_g1~~TRINITY_DN1723_c0_g1_i6.p1  ORF type:complete len:348 (-),score=39.09 TRINITY_DN1723_c0_g1_i6:71-1114(-)